MYPTLLSIGRLRVSSFGVFLAAAFIVATVIVHLELRRKRERTEGVWPAAGATMIAGLLGARLYYAVLHWQTTIAQPWAALTARGGLVWYGGFLGGTLAVIFYVRRAKIGARVLSDVLAPALALSYAVGRIGCFLVGDDYGLPSAVPWAIKFTEGSPPSTAYILRTHFGVPIQPGISDDTVLAVHPTQLYEASAMVIVFALLWAVRRRRWPDGAMFSLYLMLAGLERVLVEILRVKDDRFFGSVTVAQCVGLASVITGVVLGAWWLKKDRGGFDELSD